MERTGERPGTVGSPGAGGAGGAILVRTRVYYSGEVQGVGFRYTARSVGRGRVVTGFVRNLPDGRVEVVVEGEADEAGAFLAEVEEAMAGYISRVESREDAATGEFSAFSIRF